MTSFLFALAGFAAYLTVCTAALRLWRSVSPVALLPLLAILCWAAALGAGFTIGGPGAVGFWPLTALFWFLFAGFFFVFCAVYKSLSLRLLHDMLADPGRQMDKATAVNGYLCGESFESRLRALAELGLVIRANGQLTMTRKGRLLAAAMAWVQGLMRVHISG